MTSTGFVDLDRTLVYSRKALGLGTSPGSETLVPVEHVHGKPHSFVTVPAAAALSRLVRAGRVIPVTTRTLAQVRRLSLPGGQPEWVLAANGGRLLRHGIEDLDYSALVSDLVTTHAAPWREVASHLAQLADKGGAAWIRSIKDVEGLFFSIRVQHHPEPHVPPEQLDQLAHWCAELGWAVSFHGRRLYCLPSALTKVSGARHVTDALAVSSTYAVGDSHLDRELLLWADHALRPAHGELEEARTPLPGVAVTSARGVLAGEEIALWLEAQLLPEP